MEVGMRALDISLRAIDAYKKTLLVDKVTSDDEGRPPVYVLNEISNILMSCSLDLTKEIVEYTFRRLRHRSPHVKYKVLRFIKYTLNKVESSAYRRELQRYSIKIRELFNFQGQMDPLVGDTFNQAVRDAAHDAMKAIFSLDGSIEVKGTRIEGFGSDTFSIKSLSSSPSCSLKETEREDFLHNDDGENTQHILRESFIPYSKGTDSFELLNGKHNVMEKKSMISCNSANFHHNGIGKQLREETSNGSCHQQSEEGSHQWTHRKKVLLLEEKLVNKVTTANGSRLRPTGESLKFFFLSAKSLSGKRIADALKAKLLSSSWQERLNAAYVIRSILNQEDIELLQAIHAEFADFRSLLNECAKYSQVSLRKEAEETISALARIHDRYSSCNNGSPSCDPSFVAEGHGLSCSQAFVTRGVNDPFSYASSTVSLLPAVECPYGVDLLNMETLACEQSSKTVLNSVRGDRSPSLSSNEPKEPNYVDDLFFSTSPPVHSEPPFESGSIMQSLMINFQSSELQNQHKTETSSLNSLVHSMANASVNEGSASSFNNWIPQPQSDNIRLMDSSGYHQVGKLESLHANSSLI
ncbi:hypothetical protein KP509_08G041600 [Ceratopteris richardii]|uniref:VHS domain-containing protein n=1 Tax=Ceratopteris richardii TaxID=49495 RepID=A0A8T2U529_CERRI|nr:hypothetical protein KP509_08G041600 [Ceratopteris richardii]